MLYFSFIFKFKFFYFCFIAIYKNDFLQKKNTNTDAS